MLRIHRILKNPDQLPEDFWSSADSELMLDERWSKEHEAEINFLAEKLPFLNAHVWISSSGTMSVDSKWIAISKDALLRNAQSVNLHLNIVPQDTWALTLPLSHVGGLSIHARSYLLKQKILSFPHSWSTSSLEREDFQWVSLVPTQVYDLVEAQSLAPKNVKGVIVGGDALDDTLYQSALKLGWPILRTYGMSEVGSQLATEDKIGSGLKTLDHVRLKFDEGSVFISSECLYTQKVITDFETLKIESRLQDWWALPDRVELADGRLTVLGRDDLVVKVLGLKLDIVSLEAQLKKILGFEVVIVTKPDDRRGLRLILVSEKQVNLDMLNIELLGFQQLSEVKLINEFPRTSLGKIKRGQLG